MLMCRRDVPELWTSALFCKCAVRWRLRLSLPKGEPNAAKLKFRKSSYATRKKKQREDWLRGPPPLLQSADQWQPSTLLLRALIGCRHVCVSPWILIRFKTFCMLSLHLLCCHNACIQFSIPPLFYINLMFKANKTCIKLFNAFSWISVTINEPKLQVYCYISCRL